jgi:hypothetical protein
VLERGTLETWMRDLELEVEKKGEALYRVGLPNGADLPPFYVQLSENWLLLSMLPVFTDELERPEDFYFRLLSVNRDMRIGKFALGQDDEVVLSAELPTESLDFSEFSDATERLAKYYRHYKKYLLET